MPKTCGKKCVAAASMGSVIIINSEEPILNLNQSTGGHGFDSRQGWRGGGGFRFFFVCLFVPRSWKTEYSIFLTF